MDEAKYAALALLYDRLIGMNGHYPLADDATKARLRDEVLPSIAAKWIRHRLFKSQLTGMTLKRLRSVFADKERAVSVSPPGVFKTYWYVYDIAKKNIDRLISLLGPKYSCDDAAELILRYCIERRLLGEHEMHKVAQMMSQSPPSGRSDSQDSQNGADVGGERQCDRGIRPGGDFTEASGSDSGSPRPESAKPTESAITGCGVADDTSLGENPEVGPSGAATPNEAVGNVNALFQDSQRCGYSANHSTTSDMSDVAPQAGETPTEEADRVAPSFGGMFGPEKVVIDRELSRHGAEIARRLERIIKLWEAGVEGNPSPRIDGRRLVTELVTKRFNLGRARRQEVTKRQVVLICDQSGSCAAVCRDTKHACYAVAQKLKNCVVLNTSNESVISIVRGPREIPTTEPTPIGEVLGELRLNVGLAVIWGDTDGASEYEALANRNADLIWLDSYCCSYGPRLASTKLRAVADGWKKQPLFWAQGIRTALDTAIMLRLAEKTLRGG